MANIYEKGLGKFYNIEWYQGNGGIRTTSAKLIEQKNGYVYFMTLDDGLFIIEQRAIRSLECVSEFKG